jgi:UDP-glucose 4-epimerase
MSVAPEPALRFLLTGAAGFLGSNLAERLLGAGHSVIGVDDLSMGTTLNFEPYTRNPAFTFVKRDITKADAFADVTGPIDCIVHLAAFKIPRYGKALDTLRINQAGTERTLELARLTGARCVIASTSDVYGRNPQLPFSEASTDSVIGSSKTPRWAYAVSKLYDEHLALAYQDAYGVPVTVARIFGSYGPRQHLSWWAGPPAVFIDAVLNNKPIPIHGDGQQTRSFTYVDDTVAGLHAAAVRPEARGEIINIGNAEEVTILDLARRIKRLSGTPGELDVKWVPYESFSSRKYEDVMRRVPDTTLCRKLLGVTAQVALDEGLARTIEWQREAQRTRAFQDA